MGWLLAPKGLNRLPRDNFNLLVRRCVLFRRELNRVNTIASDVKRPVLTLIGVLNDNSGQRRVTGASIEPGVRFAQNARNLEERYVEEDPRRDDLGPISAFKGCAQLGKMGRGENAAARGRKNRDHAV